MSALYGTQYGLSVDTNACAHVPVEADVALGMQPRSSSSYMALVMVGRPADHFEGREGTSLVLLDPAHPQLFLEQPEAAGANELSIEMDRDAPQPDQDQPPAGKEEGVPLIQSRRKGECIPQLPAGVHGGVPWRCCRCPQTMLCRLCLARCA